MDKLISDSDGKRYVGPMSFDLAYTSQALVAVRSLPQLLKFIESLYCEHMR